MANARRMVGPLLAGTLGVATTGFFSPGIALCGPATGEIPDEIVVTAVRQSDAAMTTKVATALRQDPYIFGDHITVITENGVVRLEGIVSDLEDLHTILKLARRIAGKGRLVDALEYVPTDDDGN